MEVLILLVLLVFFGGTLCGGLHNKKEWLVFSSIIALLGIVGALACFMGMLDVLIKIVGLW